MAAVETTTAGHALAAEATDARRHYRKLPRHRATARSPMRFPRRWKS